MGHDVSMYPRFHFIVIPALPATVYYEVTANNLISHNMNEVVARVLGMVPGELKKECFQDVEFANTDAFKQYSFLILDEKYAFVAFVTYTIDSINGQTHYVAWNVCTAERFRGKRIISKVLLFSIEYLKSLGNSDIQYVSLYVLKNNTTAQKVYEKLGFMNDLSFNDDTLFRGTRPLNWIPSELSPEAQQPLSSTERNILEIRPIDEGRENTLVSEFRTAYLNATRRFVEIQNANGLIQRDRELASIREKYQDLPPSVMNEIITGITLSDQSYRSENDVKVTESNLDEWASIDPEEEKRRVKLEVEFERKEKKEQRSQPSAKRLEEQFHIEYYGASEKLYDALTDPHITFDQYVTLKSRAEKIEENYAAQLGRDDMKTVINQVVLEITDNPKYSEDWAQINSTRILFEQELMNGEREDTGKRELDISLLATTQAHASTTTFAGHPEQQLTGMAYLAGKHKDTCCVYRPRQTITESGYESVMIIIKCDGQGNWTINGPSDLGSQIAACKKPFFLILLGIMRTDGSQAHQNLLIYDTAAKAMERFEPHGTAVYGIDELVCYNSGKIDIVVKKWLDDTSEGCIIYVPPIDYCPNTAAFQFLEQTEPDRLATDPEGFCVAWSLWYADVRLGSPNVSRKDVIKHTSEFLQEQGSLRTFIRNYANYFERVLATVRAIIAFSLSSVPVEEWIIGHWYELSRMGPLRAP